jgi:hypothetical protein
MHHIEIEQEERRRDDLVARVREEAIAIRRAKAEAAMRDLRKREPIVDEYDMPTYEENIRVKDQEFIDLTNDVVHHPSHYTQGGIECIEILEQLAADGHDFRILNAIKYLWRYQHKGGDESLRKAIWYIQRTLERP